MAIATPPAARLITYEDYLAEPDSNLRCEIIDGIRYFMSNPTRRHQDILSNVAEILRGHLKRAKSGKAYVAPCDVLITRSPLRTRQPDVLVMSNARLSLNPPDTDPAPLDPAPELVIEILSPSNYRRATAEPLSEYASVGVLECWLVSPEAETVEVVKMNQEGFETVGVYFSSQTVTSITFPELTVEVDDLFAE